MKQASLLSHCGQSARVSRGPPVVLAACKLCWAINTHICLFKYTIIILAGLKIDTVVKATNIFPLATKNYGLVATLATRFLYDLHLN